MGPVLVWDERGVYPSSLDAAVMEQRRYYGVGSWPRDVAVPLRAVRGPRLAPVGVEVGDLCGRTYGTETCLAKLELRPAEGLGGCTCWRSAPCASCMSIVPECPRGCWRGEEP